MDAQDKEIAQLKESIKNDVKSLIDKYMTIVSWDVPENDEDEAKIKILNIVKETISQIEDSDI